MASRKQKNRSSKKRHLEKAKNQTKWAPFWTVLKKFGKGKKIHPSAITHVKRNWRRSSLKIKPRTTRKNYLG
jgi:ribosomal protein L39E